MVMAQASASGSSGGSLSPERIGGKTWCVYAQQGIPTAIRGRRLIGEGELIPRKRITAKPTDRADTRFSADWRSGLPHRYPRGSHECSLRQMRKGWQGHRDTDD